MDLSFLEQLEAEELLFKKFSLVGTGNVLAAGSLKAGYAVNINAGADTTLTGTAPIPGACCYNDGTCDDITEADCTAAGGDWQGLGTTCDDDPPPCVGVCCEPGCVDNSTPDSCDADGGTWMGFGTACDDDPPPCELPPCNGCGFDAFDGSGRKFLTRTTVTSVDQEVDCDACPGFGNPNDIGTWTCTDSYDEECVLTSGHTGSEGADYCDGRHVDLGPRCDCFGDVVSATELHYHLDAPDPPCTPVFIIDVVCTLSDECTP